MRSRYCDIDKIIHPSIKKKPQKNQPTKQTNSNNKRKIRKIGEIVQLCSTGMVWERIRKTTSHATRQGTLGHSRLSSLRTLWTEPSLKSGISVSELISTLKKTTTKKRRRRLNCQTFSPNPRTRGRSHPPTHSFTQWVICQAHVKHHLVSCTRYVVLSCCYHEYWRHLRCLRYWMNFTPR